MPHIIFFLPIALWVAGVIVMLSGGKMSIAWALNLLGWIVYLSIVLLKLGVGT